ncbi:MAG: hypothetical protein ACYTHJ_21045 [Planctomycetota bacterium]
MNITKSAVSPAWWVPCITILLGHMPALASVDLTLEPEDPNVAMGANLDIQLVARNDEEGMARVSAVSVVLVWDPEVIQLTGSSEIEPGTWLATGFFPDPDGINDALDDGDAVFTALASPANIVEIPMENMALAAFSFQAMTSMPNAQVVIQERLLEFGETAVFHADIPNLNILGSVEGASVNILQCGSADSDVDSIVDMHDFVEFHACFTGVQTEASDYCACLFDMYGDADVDLEDFADFQVLFSAAPP